MVQPEAESLAPEVGPLAEQVTLLADNRAKPFGAKGWLTDPVSALHACVYNHQAFRYALPPQPEELADATDFDEMYQAEILLVGYDPNRTTNPPVDPEHFARIVGAIAASSSWQLISVVDREVPGFTAWCTEQGWEGGLSVEENRPTFYQWTSRILQDSLGNDPES